MSLLRLRTKLDCDLENVVKKCGCVRLPEWSELPEWTTGMDFYMWLLVLLMHFICTEWHAEATESRKYEYHAFYVPQKLKLTS